MNRRVQVQPLADADLDEQAAYIARESPRSARRFYEAAEATFNFSLTRQESVIHVNLKIHAPHIYACGPCAGSRTTSFSIDRCYQG